MICHWSEMTHHMTNMTHGIQWRHLKNNYWWIPPLFFYMTCSLFSHDLSYCLFSCCLTCSNEIIVILDTVTIDEKNKQTSVSYQLKTEVYWLYRHLWWDRWLWSGIWHVEISGLPYPRSHWSTSKGLVLIQMAVEPQGILFPLVIGDWDCLQGIDLLKYLWW